MDGCGLVSVDPEGLDVEASRQVELGGGLELHEENENKINRNKKHRHGILLLSLEGNIRVDLWGGIVGRNSHIIESKLPFFLWDQPRWRPGPSKRVIRVKDGSRTLIELNIVCVFNMMLKVPLRVM